MTRASIASKAAAIATSTLALAVSLAPATAAAFCGFYVSGADAELYNNATLVVMMREGTRTVLAMQNSYQGPPENFAMVVPVPVVLQRENVKTLDRELFRHVDALAAPRLVEYWEQDPCAPQMEMQQRGMMPMAAAEAAPAPTAPRDLGVRVEARFTVGEYQIVILSAQYSSGLETWLRRERYNIPPNAEPVLRPYVQAGTKFFVARVDVSKVRFVNGQVMLSPLRFHYDSDEFTLPVRLGLLNSAGTQDLLVHILARGQRYEVANYRNVTVPTNIDVADDVRHHFGGFYASLFDRTVEQNPGAVVTEYSWDANTCDPCPTPALDPSELATLGADVLPGDQGPYGFVLTRLHYRYTRDTLGQDLVFRAAGPIVGGREIPGPNGRVEERARPDSVNNFQGRYVIRHAWQGAIACENPRRGIWGGPPGGGEPQPVAARDIAFAPRGAVNLGLSVRQDIPEIAVRAGVATPTAQIGGTSAAAATGTPGPSEGGCASCRVADGEPSRWAWACAPFAIAFALLALRGMKSRRRRAKDEAGR